MTNQVETTAPASRRPKLVVSLWMILGAIIVGVLVVVVPILWTGPEANFWLNPLTVLATLATGLGLGLPTYPLALRLLLTRRELSVGSQLLTVLPGLVLFGLLIAGGGGLWFQLAIPMVWAVLMVLVAVALSGSVQRFWTMGLTAMVVVAGIVVGVLGYPFQIAASGAVGKDPQITRQMRFGLDLVDAYERAYDTRFSVEANYSSISAAPMVDFLDLYPCGFNEVLPSVSYNLTVEDGKLLDYRNFLNPTAAQRAKIRAYMDQLYPSVKPSRGLLYRYEGGLYAFGPIGVGTLGNEHPSAGLSILSQQQCTSANLMPADGSVSIR